MVGSQYLLCWNLADERFFETLFLVQSDGSTVCSLFFLVKMQFMYFANKAMIHKKLSSY